MLLSHPAVTHRPQREGWRWDGRLGQKDTLRMHVEKGEEARRENKESKIGRIDGEIYEWRGEEMKGEERYGNDTTAPCFSWVERG